MNNSHTQIVFLILLLIFAKVQTENLKAQHQNHKQSSSENKQHIVDLLQQEAVPKSRVVGPEPLLTYRSKLIDKLPRFIDNLEFLGQGYNIYRGNPRCTQGLDPGYRNFGVTNFDYDQSPVNALNRDYTMYVPKGFSATHQQSCTISFTSQAITSTSQYKEQLKVGASISGNFGAAAFSFSADYGQNQEKLSSSTSYFIETTAKCTAYEVTLKQGKDSSPGITTAFQEAARELEALGDQQEAYYDFFDEIGTHVTDEIELGSLFGYRFEMSVSESSKLQSLNVDIEASASYLATKGKVKTSYEQSQQEQLKTAINSWKSYSIGAVPNKDNDVLQWAARTISDPMPVSINLISMPDYIRTYGSAIKLGMTDVQYNNLLSRMDKHILTYCNNRLIQNLSQSCSFINIEAPINLNNQGYVNFINQLSDGITLIMITNKKAAKTISFQSVDGWSVFKLDRYFSSYYQKYYLVKVPNYVDRYIIKSFAFQYCLVMLECDIKKEASYIVMQSCNIMNPCQQFKIEVYDNNKNEVIITSIHYNTNLLVQNAYEGQGESIGVFSYNDPISRVWRIQKAL